MRGAECSWSRQGQWPKAVELSLASPHPPCLPPPCLPQSMANSTLIDVGCHLDHPAVLAWSRLQPERVEPAGLVQLKGKLNTAVFRLDGVGPDGSNVIAKRCRTSTARVERIIYEHLLARLPLPTLRIYGFVPDGEYCWLFLEDAGSGRYEPS